MALRTAPLALAALTLATAALLVVAPTSCGDEGDQDGTGGMDFYPVYDGEPVGAPADETITPKVMIIGLDGADFRNIDPLVKAGRLPHLTKLMRDGAHGQLATIATASPIVWTSVATGVRPEVHGIRRVPNRGSGAGRSGRWSAPPRRSGTSCRTTSRSVGVISWWATYPAERVEGYLVSPYVVLQPPAGLRARAHPLGSKKDDGTAQVVSTRPPRPGIADLLRRPEDVDLSKYADVYADKKRTTNTPWVIAKDTSYHEIALRLLEERPVETIAVYYQGIDAVSHDWDRWVMGPQHEPGARSPR